MIQKISVFTLFAKILKKVVFIIIRYFHANDVWSLFWNNISFCQISNRYSVASITPIIQAIRVYMVLLHITKTIRATRSKVFGFVVLRKHGLRAWEDTQLFSLKEDETIWLLNLFWTCKIMRNARIIMNLIAIDKMIWFFLSSKFPAVSLQNLLHFAAVQRMLPTFLNGFHSTCGIRIFIGFLESFISYTTDCRLCLSSKKYFERKRRSKIKNLPFLFSCADLHFFVLKGQQRKHISTPIVDVCIVIIQILLYLSVDKMAI